MPVISIKIKSSGDKKYDVEVDTESTIEDLKTIISATADVAPEHQRLIYSGKVLKDTETVAFYKIQNDHSIHLVKSSAAKARAQTPAANPGAAAAGSTSATNTGASASASTNAGSAGSAGAVPSNIAAGQGSFNPLADLTGARYAGYTQLPSASMFGPDGGMGAFPDPEQLDTIMQNPMFQEQMNALLSDPRMLDMMIDQNPQLRGMGPEARQMLRPMFREMMANPESLRSMMSMGRAAQAGGGLGGLGGMGGLGALGGAGGNSESAFPAPGSNPTVEDGSAGGAGAEGSTGANAPGANPLSNMFGSGAPGFNPFSLGGLGGSQAAAPVDNRPPEEKYESQLAQLNEMGFSNFEQNVAALRRSGGNVQGALEFLLSGGF